VQRSLVANVEGQTARPFYLIDVRTAEAPDDMACRCRRGGPCSGDEHFGATS